MKKETEGRKTFGVTSLLDFIGELIIAFVVLGGILIGIVFVFAMSEDNLCNNALINIESSSEFEKNSFV